MANGSAALHLVPTPESKDAAVSSPTAAPAATAIGIAMADACEAIGRSLADLDAGGLTAANRARGGETIAAVVELQLAHFGAMPDFGALAIAEGKRILHARHDAILRQHLGSDAGIDATFDMLLSNILAVASKVAAVERVFRSN